MREINKAHFDTTVRPQDDFYRYVNGGWLKKNSIPATEMRWGSFDILIHKTRRQLHALLRGLSKDSTIKAGSDAVKLCNLFRSSMDMKRRNTLGLEPLEEGFRQIESLTSIDEFSRVFAWLHEHGVSAPWGVWIDQDDKESNRMVFRIGQGGLGVPDRNYHVKKDKESKRIRKAYEEHIHRILGAEKNHSAKEINTIKRTVLRIETALAKASMTPVERRDAHAMYNKHTLTDLRKTYPVFGWRRYFDELGIPEQARAHIIIDQPKFLKKVSHLLKEVSLEEWKVYLRWHFLDTFLGALGEDFVEANFEYSRVLNGTQKLPELWKRSVSICNQLMGDTLSRLYVEEYFPPSAKREIGILVKNLVATYRSRIKKLEWMSEKTKKKALNKLDTMSVQLGYPRKWQSYKQLHIDRKTFGENVLRGVKFDFDLNVQKLTKPTDRTRWYMTAATVNAYYSPNLNQIVFPAAILQPPFFYAGGDQAVNYGAIGSVIAHELTHGFDDSGSKFDEFGNLKNWWLPQDRKQFEKRTNILIKQFNAFEVADGVRVNGKLTLGENIADLGGVVIAHEAFIHAQKEDPVEKKEGLTPIERFFIGYAITERCLVRDEYVKLQALNDPHSPSEFRVNGIVAHSDAFQKVFGLEKGAALYRSAKERAEIW